MTEQPSQTPQPPNGSQEHSIPPSSTPAETGTDSAVKPEPDIDASIEKDIEMNADQTQPSGDDNAPLPTDDDPLATAPQPSKKETSLREFLGKMDDYAPIVRDIFLSPFSSTTLGCHHPVKLRATSPQFTLLTWKDPRE